MGAKTFQARPDWKAHTFMLAGPSCAGKTTLLTNVVERLNRRFSDSARYAIKYTTKQTPRANADPTLRPITPAAFSANPTAYAFVGSFGGFDYGILQEDLHPVYHDRFFAMADPQAIETLLLNDLVVPIYVTATWETLQQRLVSRKKSGQLEFDYESRVARLEKEFGLFEQQAEQRNFRYVLQNEGRTETEADSTAERLVSIVLHERNLRHTYPNTTEGHIDLHDDYIQWGLMQLFGGTFVELREKQKSSITALTLDKSSSVVQHSLESVIQTQADRILGLQYSLSKSPLHGVVTAEIRFGRPVQLPLAPAAVNDAEALREILQNIFRTACGTAGERTAPSELSFRLTDLDPNPEKYQGNCSTLFDLRVKIFPEIFGNNVSHAKER